MATETFVLTPVSQKEMSPFKRFLRHFDWVLFGDVVILTGVGLVMVYSATLRSGHPETYFIKQSAAFFIGLAGLFLMATLNYQIFRQHPKFLFIISISLLVLVLLAGSSHRGTKAWLALGPVWFQPSEISKFIVILVLASLCDIDPREMRQVKSLILPLLVVLVHIGLILCQPDFGSSLVYFPIVVGMLYAAGASLFHLFIVLFLGLFSGTLVLLQTALSLSSEFLQMHPVWNYFYHGLSFGKEMIMLQIGLGLLFIVAWWFLKQLRFRIYGIFYIITFLLIVFGWASSSVFTSSLKEYQRKRLVVFFKPQIDPLGSGYHVIQSEVAVGSGKIFGKGLFSGTQGRLGFLPEQHTDFIFSIMGEELGFVVSGIVIFFYFLLVWRAISIGADSRDRYGSLIAVGVGSMFAFYVILNLGMVMGVAPITGLPLPFLSYGGSSLASSLTAVGILLSIHVRRYAH